MKKSLIVVGVIGSLYSCMANAIVAGHAALSHNNYSNIHVTPVGPNTDKFVYSSSDGSATGYTKFNTNGGSTTIASAKSSEGDKVNFIEKTNSNGSNSGFADVDTLGSGNKLYMVDGRGDRYVGPGGEWVVNPDGSFSPKGLPGGGGCIEGVADKYKDHSLDGLILALSTLHGETDYYNAMSGNRFKPFIPTQVRGDTIVGTYNGKFVSLTRNYCISQGMTNKQYDDFLAGSTMAIDSGIIVFSSKGRNVRGDFIR